MKIHTLALHATFLHTTIISRGIRSPIGLNSSHPVKRFRDTLKGLQKDMVSQLAPKVQRMMMLIEHRKQKIHAAKQQNYRS
jgi:hypothetical protein